MKKFIQLITVIGFTIFTHAQERTISGVVSDEMGPVADILVKVLGTNKGTVTDFDGNYSIKAQTGNVLEFTHVSYVSIEKVVGESNKVDVLMKDSCDVTKCYFGCYFETKRYVEVGYFRSMDNLFNGFYTDLSYSIYNIFNKTFIPSIRYKTDLINNKELHIGLALETINIADKYLTLKLSYNELELKSFNNKDLQLEAKTFFYNLIPNKSLGILLIFGLEDNVKNQFGYGFGMQQMIINNLTLSAKLIKYGDHFNIQNKLKYTYKKFDLFIEHRSINKYENIIYGAGYKINI